MNYQSVRSGSPKEECLREYRIDQRKRSTQNGCETYRPGKGWPAYQNSNVLFAAPKFYEKDTKHRRKLYSDISRKMVSYVEQALDEFTYETGPVLGERTLTKELVAKMADRVLDWAGYDMEQVEEIMLEDKNPASMTWHREQLLRAVVETLILHEFILA